MDGSAGDEELYGQALASLKASVALLETLGRQQRHVPSAAQRAQLSEWSSRCAAASSAEAAADEAPTGDGPREVSREGSAPPARGGAAPCSESAREAKAVEAKRRMHAWKARARQISAVSRVASHAKMKRQRTAEDKERLRIATVSHATGKAPEQVNTETLTRAVGGGDAVETALRGLACCRPARVRDHAPRAKRKYGSAKVAAKGGDKSENVMLKLAMMQSKRENSKFVVHPDSVASQRFTYAIILALAVTVFEAPIALGFGGGVTSGGLWLWLGVALDALFLADVALNCVMGFHDGPDVAIGAGTGCDVGQLQTAPLSVVSHSFRLIFRRAIVSRSDLEA